MLQNVSVVDIPTCSVSARRVYTHNLLLNGYAVLSSGMHPVTVWFPKTGYCMTL